MDRDARDASIGCGAGLVLLSAPVWLVLGYVMTISFGPAQGVPLWLDQIVIYGTSAALAGTGVYMIAKGVRTGR